MLCISHVPLAVRIHFLGVQTEGVILSKAYSLRATGGLEPLGTIPNQRPSWPEKGNKRQGEKTNAGSRIGLLVVVGTSQTNALQSVK